jgi:hypothetical protein
VDQLGDNVWAVALMVALAAVIAIAFIALWVRDKGRADEVSEDPERAHTDSDLGSDAREGAADEPPDVRRERRHS